MILLSEDSPVFAKKSFCAKRRRIEVESFAITLTGLNQTKTRILSFPFILDANYRLVCGEPNLFENVVKFQTIMSMVVVFIML